MRHLFAILVSFSVVACSSCAAWDGPAGGVYANAPARAQYAAAVRVFVVCPDMSMGAGTGVAISSRQVLTARHVIDCDGQDPTSILAKTIDGAVVEMLIDELASGDTDAARLIVDSTGHPFVTWATIAPRPVPKYGTRVCAVVYDGNAGVLRKCGEVGQGDADAFVISLACVPGNSGSAIYDGDGYLVGILVAGTWALTQEKITLAVPVRAFADLRPKDTIDPRMMAEDWI